ncbi:hypothetical protein K3495_g9208 [Podosphaera aphanis]|nr:hypothetical protein K3495_g9208 [Podosphaera aphanis]
MYFSLKEKIVVTATLSGGVYIVSEIAPDFDEVALAADNTLNLNYISSSHEISEDDRTHDLSDDDGELDKNERARWRKYHRRFGHFGIGKLRYLHEFSNLKRPTRKPKRKDICKVCKIAKITKKKRNTLAKWESTPVALVSVDICGPFPSSLRGHRYWAEVIDNATRRKLLILGLWALEDGIRSESTAAYNSYQNGPAERNFRTTEECMRAKLEEAKLPIEFWDEAVEATNSERTHIDHGPLTKSGKHQCVLQAWKELEDPIDISHIRVWDWVAHSHVVDYLGVI